MLPNRPDKPKTTLTAAPKSCAWAQDQVFAYLDGDLTPGRKAEFEAHLETCAACHQEVALSRRSELALGSAVRAVPPAGDLRTGFYARLAAERQKPPRPLWIGWRLAVPALAAGLLILFGTRALHTFNQDNPSTTKNAGTPHPPIGETPGRNLVRATPGKFPSLPGGMSSALALSLPSSQADKQDVASNDSKTNLQKRRQVTGHARRSGPLVLASLIRIRQVIDTKIRSKGYDALAYSDTPVHFSNLREEKRNFPYASESLDKKSEEQERLRALALKVKKPAQVSTASLPAEVSLHVSDEVRGFMASTHIAHSKRGGQAVLAIDAEDESSMPAELPALP